MSGWRFRHNLILIILASAAAFIAPVAASAQDPTIQLPKRPVSPLGPGFSQGAGQRKSGDQLVKLTTAANTQEISPGERFVITFLFEIEPHWHIYWKNSGSSGAPTEIKITAPSGFSVGKTLFPRPMAFADEEGTTFGYQDKIALFVEVTAPNTLPGGTLMFNVSANWLVCKDICLMGRASKVLTLSTAGGPGNKTFGTPARDSAPGSAKPSSNQSFDDPFIQQCWHRLPRLLKDVEGAEVTFDRKNLSIKMPAQTLRDVSLYPIDSPGVSLGDLQITIPGDHLILTIPVEINPGNSQGKPLIATGLVALGKTVDDPCFEFEFPLSTP